MQTVKHNFDFKLLPRTVDVWREELDVSAEQIMNFYAQLSDDEKARAERFRFPHLKHRYIAGRGILRVLSGRYLGMAAKELVFAYGEQGKPYLPDFPNFQFNISHADTQAIFAFAEGSAVGVDVEFIDPEVECEKLAPRFFSANEARKLMALPKAKRAAAFFSCWTRKEAFIKYHGGGLSIPLDSFEVAFLPGEEVKVLTTDDLSLTDVRFGDARYAGAVLVREGFGVRFVG